jgi:CheY-like chemotaxis protein
VVLVVEDDIALLTLATSVIETHDFEALSAANAKEALALFEDGAAIDVLFTDINLPDGTSDALDGFELARRAVTLCPAGLRVIYTTGGGLTDGATALFVDGAMFLAKPYTHKNLIAALRGEPGNAAA